MHRDWQGEWVCFQTKSAHNWELMVALRMERQERRVLRHSEPSQVQRMSGPMGPPSIGYSVSMVRLWTNEGVTFLI